MALKILYQSKQKSKNSRETRYKITRYGNQAEINAYIATLIIGTTTEEGLVLSAWRKSQYAAGIYQIENEYTTLDNSFSYSTLPDSEVGVKSAQLSVRNLQLPLEKLNGYLMNWNHYIIHKGDISSLPTWWHTAGYGDLIPAADRQEWRWVNSIAQVPLEPDENGEYWMISAEPTKPGVEYFDYAYFVVTENAKYKTASDAGTAINKNINKIVSPSNTFGITGGNWKLDESSVRWQGNYWLASSVYTHSPTGWETDLYGPNATIVS